MRVCVVLQHVHVGLWQLLACYCECVCASDGAEQTGGCFMSCLCVCRVGQRCDIQYIAVESF